MIVMPESPKFLYVKNNYNQVRLIIKRIQTFNGVESQDKMIFDKELLE